MVQTRAKSTIYSGPTTNSSEISLLQATEMAKKICEFATYYGDAILVDYVPIAHSLLNSDLDMQPNFFNWLIGSQR